VKQITNSEFEAEVLRSKEPVLVDFFTDGCQPCRTMAPMLQEMETEAKGAFKVVKVDAAAETALAVSYRINAVPAFFAFANGKCVGQTVGMKSKSSMKKWFDDALRSGA
jgi:thioredoxin 1